MNIKEDYKREIGDIISIWAKAKLFYNDSLYLSNPKSDKESAMISKNRVLNEIRYSLWVLTVLELCKLFDDNNNQCFNLFKFIRKIKQDRNKLIFKDKITSITINDWENKLQNNQTFNTIGKLKDLRDKYYAHSDRKPELLPEELTPNINSIEELLRIGQEIIYEFQGTVFDIDQDFETPILAGQILDDLTELAEYRDKYK
ncbi:MAG: hypothetical protein IMY69_01600 [Bacteroidetes bacterium]|nr:hypothetical protein [Bacteroidota bacterium]